MNRVLVCNADKTQINAFGRIIPVTCDVRSLEDGRRQRNEVVRTEPPKDCGAPVPYSPRVFPSGDWHIYAITAETDPLLAPWFIAADAKALVDEWELNSAGFYWRKTGRQVWDAWYGIHNSTDPHTLGCLRVASPDDQLWLVAQIRDVWGGGLAWTPGHDQVRLSI